MVNHVNNSDDPFPNLSPHPLAHSLLKSIPSAPDPVPQPPLLYCPHHIQRSRRQPVSYSGNELVQATQHSASYLPTPSPTQHSASYLPTPSRSSSPLHTQYIGWNEKVR